MEWVKAAKAADVKKQGMMEVTVDGKPVALSFKEGKFGAVLGVCPHVGGPLGKGSLSGDYLVCPWHYWQLHRITGEARPGYAVAVPRYEIKEEGGDLLVSKKPVTQGKAPSHGPHKLARPARREDGPIRVAGISTTAMDAAHPRYSTSDALLEISLQHARERLKCETQLIKLNELKFRACEGFYSKAAEACTWPCSITAMDSEDQLDAVYEALVHWADVVLISTPIRWGVASALYFKMAERLNCIQNQVTTHNRVLIRNKVASFIITGGQDNIQAVAGQMLTFFAELGFHFPQFPFIAHSRGWSAEDMAANIDYVKNSSDLHEGARALVERAAGRAEGLIQLEACERTARGGRKAHALQLTEGKATS